MNERIRKLAEQAEKYADENFKGEPTYSWAYDSKFAELVIADEREACAKVCEELIAPDGYSDTELSMWDVACIDCADAILARSKT